jgi:predicted nucleic acid-binding protein
MATKHRLGIFIDTNIFLDFYRAESEASLSLLRHIESIPEGLIATDQVELEFLNNRQRVISTALQSLKAPSLPPFVPAYLSDSRAASKIVKSLNEMKNQMAAMRKRLAKILENPSAHDPVYKVVKKAFSFHSPLNLKFFEAKREDIQVRALRRFQRGLPPRKRDGTSTGDSINWEWIVECASDAGMDVVVVSRDGDYGLRFDGKHYLNDCLLQEFKARVSAKRKIEFTTSLAQALRHLSVPVTKAEEEEEKKIIALQTPPPQASAPLSTSTSIWDVLLDRIKQQSPFTHAYLKESSRWSLVDRVLTIGFSSENAGVVALIDNLKNKTRIEHELKCMGLDGIRVVFLVLSDEGSQQASMENSPGSKDDDIPF